MKKTYILSLAILFAGSSIFTSCGSDAKVEETETVEAAEEAAPVQEVIEETPAQADTTTDVEEVPVEEVEVTEVAPKPEPKKEEVKKAPVVAAKEVEQKVEEVKEIVVSAPAMTFEQTEYQFGEINQGDKVSYTFKFKNTGDAPLIISNARASCGCTVPQWPKEPVAPGAESQIDVVFNSRGKRGNQNKAVTITTNIPDKPQQVVYLKGTVNVPAPEPVEPATAE